MKHLAMVLVLGLIAMLASGCGGSTTDGTKVTTTTTTSISPPVTTVISEGSTGVRTEFFVLIPDEVPSRGDLETIVDWTFDDSRLFMYITAGDCTPEQFALDVCPDEPACACTFLARSEASQPKPRALQVQNYQGSVGLIVWNVGTRDESISWQMLLTTTATLRTSPLKATGMGVYPTARKTAPR